MKDNRKGDRHKPRKKYNREYQKNLRTRRRKAVMVLLGEKCSHCGFRDKRALQIDHIYGGGTQEHKSFASTQMYYAAILRMKEPNKKYQILCANCNWIKRHVAKEV